MRPTHEWGPVPGEDVTQQAVIVAGYFAEHGTQQILVLGEGATRVLGARVTDLPGEIAQLSDSDRLVSKLAEVRWTSIGPSRTLVWRVGGGAE